MRSFQIFCTITYLVIFLITGCSKSHTTSYNGDTDNSIVILFTDEKVINENGNQEYIQGITWKR